MEQRYQNYKRFNWSENEKWQLFMNNIFPVPTRAVLEKRRRRWYRENVDPEFDVTYEPDLNANASAGNNNNANRNQQNY